MKKTTLSIFVLILVSPALFAAQITLPTTLDKLVSTSDFVIVGNLKFDAFTYPADSIVLGDMPIASQITVQALADDDGLRFAGGFFDRPGGPGNGASDVTLGFDVTGMGVQITGASLTGNPTLKGGAEGIAEVVETFGGMDQTKLVIFDKTATLSLEDASAFEQPVSQVSVLKDILLFTASDTNAATLSVVDQHFTITPEPAASGLALLGLFGMGLSRRRRRVS